MHRRGEVDGVSAEIIPAPELRRTLDDHEQRLRKLEQERVTDRRLSSLEQRVHRLEITAAKAVVIMGAVTFVASSAASVLVALVMRAALGE